MSTNQRPVAIVTGGSRGFGRATTERLAARGWLVVIDGRDADALEATAKEIGQNVIAVPGDVSAPDHRQALLAVAGDTGRLDLLVNNASTLGPSPLPPLAGYSLNALRNVLEINTISQLALIQEALPLLRSSAGVVVNVTSDAANQPYEGWGGYGASKAALDQISNVLAAEEPSIRVYAFDPGDMNTQMHQDAFPGEDISDRPDPEQSVPALLHLIETRPASSRFQASDLLVEA